MATSIVDIRNAIFNGLLMAKTAETFILNEWDIDQTYMPSTTLPQLKASNGMVWILCGAFDTSRKKDKQNTAMRTYMVHIGIQHKLLATQVDDEDNCVRLQEQIRDYIRLNIVLDLEGVNWMEDDCLRDPNKLPFSYKAQREGNVFEQYFTIHFLEIV